MKKHIVTLVGLLFAALPLVAQPSATHYAALDGKTGAALFEAVHSAACSGYHSLGYNGLYNAYKQTDSKDGQIWDMYSDCPFPYTKKCGNYSKECDCYNREHSVPQSWWGGGTSNQGCDIFIVVPTDGKVNGMRSNYPFGEVGSATYTSANGSKRGNSSMSGYSGVVFEPVDEYKGDFARGILGAMVKWKGSWTQSDGNKVFNGNYTAAGNFGLASYGMALLLKWHRQDPVSQKERDRNNGIENTQGNRNPFIDYPCLVEYIWGMHKGERFDLSQVVSAYDSSFGSGDQSGCSCSTEPRLTQPAQGETVNMGSVLLDNTATKTITLRGANLTQALSLSLSGADSRYFSVSPTSVTASQAMAGQPVALIYTPMEEGAHSAQLTIASPEFASVVLTVTAKATKESETPDPDGDYVKLMKSPADYAGTYLIVYEDENVCLDASANVTKAPNKKSVEIIGNTIASTEETDASAVEIVAVSGGYALRLPSGDYMGSGSTGGNITLYDEPQANTISVLNGTATVTAANGTALRYNTSANCFRYYKNGQQSVSLFRKTSSTDTSDDGIKNDEVAYRIVEGRLTVESVQPASIAIYDVMGRLLGETHDVTYYEKTLPQGFYLLRVNGKSQRILVP